MPTTAQHIERQVFEFGAAPDGWSRLLGLALLAVVLVAVFAMYRREARVGASPRLRLLLAGLRSAALLGLALIALDPMFVTFIERTIPARTAVLIDASASMSAIDADAAGMSRHARVAELLKSADGEFWRTLAANNDAALYRFAGAAERLPDPNALSAAAAPPTNLDAGRTDLGRGVQAVLDDLGGQRLAAAIVCTDGAINRGMALDEIADFARRRRAKLHIVGVGAPVEPPNVQLTNVSAPAVTPLGDPFELRLDAVAVGAPHAAVELAIYRRAAAAAEASDEPLLQRRLELGGDAPTTLRLPVKPEAAGEFVYEARLAPVPGEAFVDDNVGRVVVRVIDEPLRVLLVAGRPSYEYRYLSRLLTRDRTIEASCWLQSAEPGAVRDGDVVIAALPHEPEDLFRYDALLLLDPDPGPLDASWALTVRRWVDEFGGGVLYQAGPQFATRFLRERRLADLVDVLPIAPDPDAEVRLSEAGAYQSEAAPLAATPAAAGHPLVALHGDPQVSQALWPQLPPTWWALPVQRVKPLAEPLLTWRRTLGGGGETVVLAAQPLGGGRTAFLGIDGTWRWRSRAEAEFNRFWIQMVRYLAEARRQSASRRGVLTLERETVEVGGEIAVEARVLDASFAPWHARQIEATVRLGDAPAEALTLDAVPGREGWFAGRIVASQPGVGVVRVELPAAHAGEAETLSRRFEARQSDMEMQRLRLALDELRTLAERSGGTYRDLADARGLAAEIEPAAETRVDRGPERPLWDNAWTLLGLTALLALEWTLRRRNYLL